MFWNINRIAGPIFMFVVVFFVLWKFEIFKMGTSFGIAAVLATVDFVVLTWLMQKMGGHR